MKFFKLLPLLPILVLFALTCEEAPEGIQDTLFGDTGTSAPQLDFFVQQSFDGDQNSSINWDEMIGIDVTVSNLLDDFVRNVNIEIVDIDDSDFISEYSEDVRSVSFLSSLDSALPDGYWCYNCNTVSETRIGNFYFVTNSGFGTESITVYFEATFTYLGEEYDQKFERTFTIF